MQLITFQRFDLAGVPVILFSFKPGFEYRSHETGVDFDFDTRMDIQSLTGEELDDNWKVWFHEDRVIDELNGRKEIEWRYLLVHMPSYQSFRLPRCGRDTSSDLIDRLLTHTFHDWKRPLPMDIEKFILKPRIDRANQDLEDVLTMLSQDDSTVEKDGGKDLEGEKMPKVSEQHPTTNKTEKE